MPTSPRPTSDYITVARNTAVLYVRMLIVMLVTLYTSRIVLKALGFDDYGLYNVVGGLVLMASFVSNAMGQSTQRFITFEIGSDNTDRLERTFSASLIVHSVATIIVVLLSETVGIWFLNCHMNINPERMADANIIFQLSILSFAAGIMQAPYDGTIVAHERMNVFAWISLVEVALKLGVVFIIAALPADLRLKTYAILICGVILATTAIYVFYARTRFSECRFRNFGDIRGMLLKIASFSGWNTLSSAAWIGKSQGLNLVLNIFFGTVINAAYGICNQICNTLNNFVRNFTVALNPRMTKRYAAGDYDAFYTLLITGSKSTFLLLLLLGAPILLITPQLLSIWLDNVPPYAVVFTRLAILTSLLEAYSHTMEIAVQASGRIKIYQIVIASTNLLTLPLAWLLLHYGFSPQWALIVGLCVSAIAVAERFILLRRVLPKFSSRAFIRRAFIPSATATLCAAAGYWLFDSLTPTEGIASLLVAAIYFLFLIAAVWMLVLSTAERSAIRHYIERKLYTHKNG